MFKVNSNSEKSKKGFTLIELLVSIMIIVILTGTTLVILNPNKIKGRARDGQRISDLKTIQTALEQYYLKKRAYPATVSGGWELINGTSGNLWTALVNTAATKVLDKLPADPLNASSTSTPCLGIADNRYNYIAPPRVVNGLDAGKYVLTSVMEVITTNDGNECGALTNWTSTFSSSICPGSGATASCPGNGLGNSPTFGTCDYCYGVENK